jgi:hypothetical protein
MKMTTYFGVPLMIAFFIAAPQRMGAADVTMNVGFTSSFSFAETAPTVVNFGANPPLTLTAGVTYAFVVNTPSIHPIFFTADTSNSRNAGSPDFEVVCGPGPYNNGVSKTYNNTITFTPPAPPAGQNSYTIAYLCAVHGIFYSNLITVNRAPAVSVPLVLTNPSRSNSTFSVSCLTVTGSNYVLQFIPSLSQTNWSSLSTNIGDGSVQTFQHVSATNQAFYRVQVR